VYPFFGLWFFRLEPGYTLSPFYTRFLTPPPKHDIYKSLVFSEDISHDIVVTFEQMVQAANSVSFEKFWLEINSQEKKIIPAHQYSN